MDGWTLVGAGMRCDAVESPSMQFNWRYPTHLAGMAHKCSRVHSTSCLVSVDSATVRVDLSTLLHLVIQSDLCFLIELLTNWRCRSNGKEWRGGHK